MSTSAERDVLRDRLCHVADDATIASYQFTPGRLHLEYLQLAADAYAKVLASFDDDADSGWMEAEDEEFTEGCDDPECDCHDETE